MDYLLIKVLHILGVVFLFTAFGGLIAEAKDGKTPAWRFLSAIHGTSLLLLLVTGFFMLVSLGTGVPSWALIKLILWVLIGVIVVVIRRQPQLAKVWWLSLPVLGGIAGYLAIYKPWE